MIRALLAIAALATLAAARPAEPTTGPVAAGARLGTLLGCRDCHGPDLTGHPVIDDPTIATLWSANLTRAVPRYTDVQLERAIRGGVRPDGSHLWLMDAAPYAVLTAPEMRQLIAWLRSERPRGADRPRISMGPRFIRAVQAGRFKPAAVTLARDLAAPPAAVPGQARGRHLARTACAGCHEPPLRGLPDPRPGEAPDLAVAAAYDLPAFRTLLREGRGLGGKDVGEMAAAARDRFAATLSDAEIAALHRYLTGWAARR